MLRLLNQRVNYALKIGHFKKKQRTGAYAPERETRLLQNLVEKNSGPLSAASISAIYREIMSSALSVEKDLVVAYLGPEATFTHLTAIAKFGASISYQPCHSIGDIFTEIERGRCDYGVVPIENSIEGAVNHTLDMFVESNLKICSEIHSEISHHLLSRESSLSRIKKIYSNPQVFGQCRLWLESHLQKAALIEVSSTSDAARRARRERGSAAIASELAGKMYQLRNLAGSIEDSAHNITRFLVIGKNSAGRTRQDKTSILLSIRDRVGALQRILAPFKKNGINLTKIESRPSKRKAWDYYFFVDFLGHTDEPKVQRTLRSLEHECKFMKILGSYPAV
jgi:chorismate mutase / prephenate dehydratase